MPIFTSLHADDRAIRLQFVNPRPRKCPHVIVIPANAGSRQPFPYFALLHPVILHQTHLVLQSTRSNVALAPKFLPKVILEIISFICTETNNNVHDRSAATHVTVGDQLDRIKPCFKVALYMKTQIHYDRKKSLRMSSRSLSALRSITGLFILGGSGEVDAKFAALPSPTLL